MSASPSPGGRTPTSPTPCIMDAARPERRRDPRGGGHAPDRRGPHRDAGRACVDAAAARGRGRGGCRAPAPRRRRPARPPRRRAARLRGRRAAPRLPCLLRRREARAARHAGSPLRRERDDRRPARDRPVPGRGERVHAVHQPAVCGRGVRAARRAPRTGGAGAVVGAQSRCRGRSGVVDGPLVRAPGAAAARRAGRAELPRLPRPGRGPMVDPPARVRARRALGRAARGVGRHRCRARGHVDQAAVHRAAARRARARAAVESDRVGRSRRPRVRARGVAVHGDRRVRGLRPLPARRNVQPLLGGGRSPGIGVAGRPGDRGGIERAARRTSRPAGRGRGRRAVGGARRGARRAVRPVLHVLEAGIRHDPGTAPAGSRDRGRPPRQPEPVHAGHRPRVPRHRGPVAAPPGFRARRACRRGGRRGPRHRRPAGDLAAPVPDRAPRADPGVGGVHRRRRRPARRIARIRCPASPVAPSGSVAAVRQGDERRPGHRRVGAGSERRPAP